MPIHSSVRRAFGAFFTLVLLLNSVCAFAAPSVGYVSVDGEPVRIQTVNRGYRAEFRREDGVFRFGLHPVFQDERLEITATFIFAEQLYLLVRPALQADAEPALVQIEFKLADPEPRGAGGDVAWAGGVVLLGLYDSVAAVAHEAPNLLTFSALAAAIYTYLGVKKTWEVYRARNEFIEIANMQTLAGAKTGIGLEEIKDEHGVVTDVLLKYRGSPPALLSQVAQEKCDKILNAAKP